MRKVVEAQTETVTYVVRGKLAFPTWDKGKWRIISREAFAYEVERAVPCDGQRG